MAFINLVDGESEKTGKGTAEYRVVPRVHVIKDEEVGGTTGPIVGNVGGDEGNSGGSLSRNALGVITSVEKADDGFVETYKVIDQAFCIKEEPSNDG